MAAWMPQNAPRAHEMLNFMELCFLVLGDPIFVQNLLRKWILYKIARRNVAVWSTLVFVRNWDRQPHKLKMQSVWLNYTKNTSVWGTFGKIASRLGWCRLFGRSGWKLYANICGIARAHPSRRRKWLPKFQLNKNHPCKQNKTLAKLLIWCFVLYFAKFWIRGRNIDKHTLFCEFVFSRLADMCFIAYGLHTTASHIIA